MPGLVLLPAPPFRRYYHRDKNAPKTLEENRQLKARLKKRYQDDWNYLTSEGTVNYDGFETQGLNLPTETLEKFYYQNAQRIIPGL